MKNVILNHFDECPLKDFVMPIITIYKYPLDFPNHYVARVYNLEKPSEYMVMADSHEEILTKIPQGFYRINADPKDDPHIVEVWL